MVVVAEPQVELAAGTPAHALAPWVGRYLGYRTSGMAPGTHTGMPSPRLTFIVSLDDPVDIAAMPDPAQRPARIQAFVGGLHAGPAHIAHDGRQYGLSVDLTPLGARALFGVPAGELASLVVSLDDLLGPAGRSLPDRLRSLASWPERFAVLDTVLSDAVALRTARADAVPAEVAEAFRLLVASGGSADIAGVARTVGWSRRHLSERFRREVGMAPKATARVVRFDVAKGLLSAGRGWGGLATVAAEAGYADQAHFTREFRDLAGESPTAWMARELPSARSLDPRAGCATPRSL